MLTIYKYPFDVRDTIELSMPNGARPLCVQTQSGSPTLWAMVDTNAPMVTHSFALRGTGHDCTELDCTGLAGAKYVGTFQLHGGAFVGHLFYLGEKP